MTDGFKGLRVLLVGPVPPPYGGMANQTAQLTELLRREGAQVELVATNAPYRPRWIGGVVVVRAGARLVAFIATLWRAAGRADVIHVFASSGWIFHLAATPCVWIGRRRGVPVVINYRGGGAEAFFRTSWSAVQPTLARCAAVVVPSAFLERVFVARGFAPTVVPNIVNLERFHPAEPLRTLDGARPHLVVARNLEPVYDIATALRAFRRILDRIPGATLSVAGSGESRASLEALARELGLGASVEFTGKLSNDAMADLYRRADLVLNPSLADNMPISMLEALATGVPMVSTNVGGIPDLVEDGVHASLVPPGLPDTMADAALALLSDANRRARRIAAGREHVRQFEWSQIRSRWLVVYRAAIGRGQPKPPPSLQEV